MPMIAHHRVREYPQRQPLKSLRDQFLKRRKVRLLTKQPQPTVRAIEQMVSITSQKRLGTAWHFGRIVEKG